MSGIALQAYTSSNALVQSLESENQELREQLRVMTEERDRLRRYTAEERSGLKNLRVSMGRLGMSGTCRRPMMRAFWCKIIVRCLSPIELNRDTGDI